MEAEYATACWKPGKINVNGIGSVINGGEDCCVQGRPSIVKPPPWMNGNDKINNGLPLYRSSLPELSYVLLTLGLD